MKLKGKEMEKKMLTLAPLPFQGQKRKHTREFGRIVREKGAPLYVDLFGGSGLLSHVTKFNCPQAKVVYNDYDNYSERLAQIPRTNAVLHDVREMLANIPKAAAIRGELKERIVRRLREEHEKGYPVDWITLSSSLLFSSNYVTNFDDFIKEGFWNTVRRGEYTAEGYLDGITVVHEDYRAVWERYRNEAGVVFIIDPPYLSTDTSSYRSEGYWKLSDYLDVLNTLRSEYIYFTSEKSNIIELTDWMQKNHAIPDPFAGAVRRDVSGQASYNAHYTDIMMYKIAA
jgi:site-specific DNA-adenine methylase